MSRGISSFEIEKVSKEINNEDINKNFLCVFPSDKINIMFEKMMPGKKYLFIISNTDRSDEGGTHWRSILNISPKSELLLFYSFGISDLKHFIVSDDKKTVGKVLKGIELADQKDNKLILIKLKFSMNSYENLAENKTKKLSEIAQDLLHLIHSFGKNENITNFENVWMLEDPIQKPTTATCGPFQLHFYENLFFSTKTANYTVTKN